MKYIIEIENEPFGRNNDTFFSHGMDKLYKAKGFKSLVFDQDGLDKLTPYTEPDRKAIENEVWEFASMLMNMHPDVAEDIYWSMNGGKGIGVAAEMSYPEAKSKYEEWKKQKDKIRVGDELKQITASGSPTGAKCIVVKIDGDKMNGIGKDGSLVVCSFQVKRWWTKTGRSFPEIAELLKKMGEES